MSTGKHLPQPTVRGRALVDWSANSEQVKVVVWLPKDQGCDILSEDEVEIRTLSRVTTVDWGRRIVATTYEYECGYRDGFEAGKEAAHKLIQEGLRRTLEEDKKRAEGAQFAGRYPSGCYRFKCDDRGVCHCRVCGQLGG